MKKKTVKLVSAVVVLGVLCAAYEGVNFYVTSQEEKETEEEMFNRVYDIVNNKYSRLLDKKCEIASLNFKKKELLDKIAELDKRIESL